MCGEFTRVLIALVRQVGIPAHRIYLYEHPDRADTARNLPYNVNAEVLVDGRWVVFDVFYNVSFTLAGGRLATREDLVRDRSLLEQSAIPQKPSAYLHVAGINWSRPPVIAPLLYRGLHALIGERVNRLTLPYIFEQPALLKLVLSILLGIGSGVGLWVTRRQRKQ